MTRYKWIAYDTLHKVKYQGLNGTVHNILDHNSNKCNWMGGCPPICHDVNPTFNNSEHLDKRSLGELMDFDDTSKLHQWVWQLAGLTHIMTCIQHQYQNCYPPLSYQTQQQASVPCASACVGEPAFVIDQLQGEQWGGVDKLRPSVQSLE